ncbi:MAG: YaeQ family protein, partial [Methylophilaceae bacterium]
QRNLTVISIAQASSQGIASLAQRNMQLQCNIQEGQIWLMDDKESITVEYMVLKAADTVELKAR